MRGRMHMKNYWTVFKHIVLTFLVVLVATVIAIHVAFSFKTFENKIPDDASLWIHRGLYDNKHVFENTLPAFDSAQKHHFKGIELDVFYVDSLHDFFVTHDMPNRYQQAPLKLSEVLLRYQDSFYYWVDLKNLLASNQTVIKERFEELLKGSLKQKVFIESGNAGSLGFLANHQFQTLYWIQYNRDQGLKKFLKKTLIKMYFLKYPYAGGSIGANMADEDFFESFASIQKFIFHIYTPELLQLFKNKENTSVHLIDFIPANT